MSEDSQELDPIEPARILVIDDEEIIHHSVRKILGRHGHTVDAVLSAAEGIERLCEQDYDLVITDLMMPEMNGIELLERFKRDGIGVPVVMITGYPTIRTAVQALRLGAVDYQAKPFTRQELMGPVNRALRRTGEERVTGPPSIELGPDGEGIQAPRVDLLPGDCFVLKEHSWARFRQDGSMDVGIEDSFLRAIGEIAALDGPTSGDLVEQGYVHFRLTTTGGEAHNAFMPLSGQVVEVHGDALALPAAITAETWLVRIIPTRLDEELRLLKRCAADDA